MLCRMDHPSFTDRLDSDWLRPQWPAPARVRAVCTTRAGGESLAPFDSFNLGERVGDDPQRVAAHRAQLGASLGARPVFLHQVHGFEVITARADTPDGVLGDGAQTRHSGLACTAQVADCLPILLCDQAGEQVAALHAGWRGLAGAGGTGVVERGVAAMDAAPGELLAWLGPCIGPQAFEVGDDVRQAFVAVEPAAAACFKALLPGKWLADLPGLARQRLRAAGVLAIYGNDGSPAWCTVSQPARFFSFRRDGVCGRMAAAIALA
jgi:YfiH family protein